jgi:hypothetical protein
VWEWTAWERRPNGQGDHHMSPSTLTLPRLARQPQHPLRPVTETQRPPVVIRPFAAPVVRELPQRRVAAGTAW